MRLKFESFKYEAKYWIKKFGLFDWNWSFTQEDPPEKLLKRYESPEFLGWYEASAVDRVARLGLNKDISDERDYNIAKAAFHEVCEILLFDMEDIGLFDAAPSTKTGMEIRKHAVIRRLEHVLFKPDYKLRLMAGKTRQENGTGTTS